MRQKSNFVFVEVVKWWEICQKYLFYHNIAIYSYLIYELQNSIYRAFIECR